MTLYEDKDWKELPDDAKAAAMILGYTEAMWDGDKTPDICNKYWTELTDEQQAAAKVIGYQEESWNDDSSSDEE